MPAEHPKIGDEVCVGVTDKAVPAEEPLTERERALKVRITDEFLSTLVDSFIALTGFSDFWDIRPWICRCFEFAGRTPPTKEEFWRMMDEYDKSVAGNSMGQNIEGADEQTKA